MRTSFRVAVATALLAPLAVAAGTASPAGAAPAPTISATSGAPGTRVDVSVTGCTSDEDAGTYRFLQVLLISGTAPNEVLAGAASSIDGAGTFVVPDWVDAAQPAVVEATCQTFDFTDESDEPAATTTYDPVAFDVLPGVGASTQLTSLSRTELAVGQAFAVDGSGCSLAGADFGGATVFGGSDLTGRTPVESVAEGFAEVTGTAFHAEVGLSNGGIETSIGGSGTEGGDFVVDDLEVVEHPTDIPPGTYNVAAYCGDEDGVTLFYRPTTITVTGTAPIGDLDLTVPAGTRTATLAGGSCTAGSVQVSLEAESADEAFGEFPEDEDPEVDALRSQPGASPLARPTVGARTVGGRRTRRVDAAPERAQRSTRALGDDGYLDAEVDPDTAGAWSISDDVSFDQGIVYGFALCGDPLAEGWFYDPQAAVVEPVEATVPTTVVPAIPPTVPAAAAPATAVAGRPTYAG